MAHSTSQVERRYDVVFFDMGDTLVHSRRPFIEHYLETFQRYGVDVEREKLATAINVTWEQVMASDATAIFEASEAASRRFYFDILNRIFDLAGISVPREAIIADIQSLFHHPDTYQIFPDVNPTLTHLRERGYRLGMVSNWNWQLPDLCDQLDLADYFEFIVASARAGYAKPNPRIFEIALEHAQTIPDRVVHIGDNPYADVRGAQAVGITGILLDRDDRFQPDGYPKIRSLDEIWEFLHP